MWIFSPLALLFRQTITCSRKWRLRLINLASFYKSPSTPVFPILSEPLRSTKCTRETVFTSELGFRVSIIMMNMQWDLVDASFLGVSETTLFVSPMKSRFRASSSVPALWTDKPERIISSLWVSRGTTLGKSCRFLVVWFSSSKSYPSLL